MARDRGGSLAKVLQNSKPAPSTTPHSKPYTAEDYRFTTKDGVLYAIELGWPKGRDAVIHALKSGVGTREVASVALLGSATPLTFQQQPDGLHIHVPAEPIGQYAYAYRISWR